MDLTDGASQDWTSRGYIQVESDGGAGVTLTGTTGDLPADVDGVLADLLADHDVVRYPAGAVVGWFSPGKLADTHVRAPAEVAADPYPFGGG